MSRRSERLLVPLALGLLLTACSAPERPRVVEGVSTAETGATCAPSPDAGPVPDGALPPRLELPPGTVVTAVAEQQGFRLVTGRVALPVDEVLEHFRQASERAGLVVQRDEDEGRSGKLDFFGTTIESGVVVAKLGCPPGETGFTVRQRPLGAVPPS